MRVIGMCQVSEWCGNNAMHIHSVFFVRRAWQKHENSKLYSYSRSSSCLCLCSCASAWCVRGHRRQSFTHLHECYIYALTWSCETTDTMAFFNPKNEKCKLFLIISFVIPIYIFVFFFASRLVSLPLVNAYRAYTASSRSYAMRISSICVFYEI